MKKIVCLLITIVLFTSCEKNKEEVILKNSLNGTYKSQDFCGSIKTITLEYKGDIVLMDGVITFNMENGIGKVTASTVEHTIRKVSDTEVYYSQYVVSSGVTVICEDNFIKQ